MLVNLGKESKTLLIFNEVVWFSSIIRASTKLENNKVLNLKFRRKRNEFIVNDN